MRVLVVEDDRDIAKAVRRALLSEGFAVELAHDGEDGLRKARDNSYDAIVLDILLPKRNGYAVCRELLRHRVQGAPPQAATSSIRGNDESESGGPVLVDLDIDQAHRCIVLLNNPGAPVEDLVPAMLPGRPRGHAQDH